jgi:hypothetical protein
VPNGEYMMISLCSHSAMDSITLCCIVISTYVQYIHISVLYVLRTRDPRAIAQPMTTRISRREEVQEHGRMKNRSSRVSVSYLGNGSGAEWRCLFLAEIWKWWLF